VAELEQYNVLQKIHVRRVQVQQDRQIHVANAGRDHCPLLVWVRQILQHDDNFIVLVRHYTVAVAVVSRKANTIFCGN
jgi:hypothetical protein